MKKLATRVLLPLTALLTIIIAGAVIWHLRGQRFTFYTDAETIREPEAQAAVRDVLWQPAVRLPGAINTAADEAEPRVTPDDMMLLFVRGSAGAGADIYASRRTAGGWSEPEPLDALNSFADELGPEPSPDGRSIWFYSDRAGGMGGYDLWVSHRADEGGWSAPENLGAAVNTPWHEYGPAITPDGGLLYFASNRPDADETGAPAADAPAEAIRLDMQQRDYDLYAAAIDGGALLPANPVVELNSDHDEAGAAVSPGGDFVYYSSNRTGGLGGFDIYRSRRLHGEHLEPRNLGPSLNTAANELDPAVTLGGFGLHFGSDRAVEDDGAGDGDEGYDLYFAASREVFIDSEVRRASIDWWAIWSAIAPLLLWLLLAAALLVALLAMGRRGQLGKLSLLAKCLLASLVAHLALMLILTAVHVTASVSELLREQRGTQVALHSASSAGDLAAQIRGAVTELSVQAPEMSESRQEIAVQDAAAAEAARLEVARAELDHQDSQAPSPQAVADAAAQRDAAQSTPVPPEASTPTSVALPETAEPMRAAEAASAPQPAAPAAHRAEATPAAETAQQARQAVELAVRPSEAPATPLETSPASDATARPAEMREPLAQSEMQPSRRAAELQLDLPVVDPKAVERRAEAPLHVDAPVAPARRQAGGAPSTPADEAPPMLASDAPAAQPLLEPGRSLAETRSDDAPPQPAQSLQSTSSAAAAAPSSDVAASSLPALPGAPVASAAAEQTAPVEPAPVAAAPRPVVEATARSDAAAPNVQVAPAPPPAPGGVRSLAASSAAEAPAPAEADRIAQRGAVAPSSDPRALEVTLPDAPSATVAQASSPAGDGPVAAHDALDAAPPAPAFADTPRSETARLAPEQRPTAPAEEPMLAAGSGVAEAPAPPTAMSELGLPELVLPNSPLVLDLPAPELGAAAPAERAAAADAIAATVTSSDAAAAPRAAIEGLGGGPDAAPSRLAPSGQTSTSSSTRSLAGGATDAGRPQPLAETSGGPAAGAAILDAAPSPLVGLALPQLDEAPSANAAAAPPDSARGAPDAPDALRAPLMRPSLARVEENAVRARRDDDLPSSKHRHEPTPLLEERAPRDVTHVASALPPPALELAVEPLAFDLSIPRQIAPPEPPFAHRAPEHREELLEQGGGSRATEEAVALALDWLARHQSPEGRWDSRGFDHDCGGCAGAGKVESDIAVTGLSLLCFLAADHSPAQPGPYQQTVERGIAYLVSRQGPAGDLLGDESMYSHGIATMALAEAYAMTRDPALESPVRRAASFIYEARNRSVGGWRYDPGQAGDTSVLGWQVMALRSAERAGIEVPAAAYEVARAWLRKVRDPWKPGLYAYQPKRRVTHSMTAEGMFVEQLLGARPNDKPMQTGADYLMDYPPRWSDGANSYYWYYATLALFQHGGRHWEWWNEQVKSELLQHQRRDGDASGSWDPEGKWATVGGRVYQTAMCTLTLEVYYRYLPLYVTER